jgi:hypothetical protein
LPANLAKNRQYPAAKPENRQKNRFMVFLERSSFHVKTTPPFLIYRNSAAPFGQKQSNKDPQNCFKQKDKLPGGIAATKPINKPIYSTTIAPKSTQHK